MSDKKTLTKEIFATEIAVLKDNVTDLKANQEKMVQHEVRLALTERALQESRDFQAQILKNTEDIKIQQQEITKTLSLLQQSEKNQWREISGLKEGVDNKANQKDFDDYKESTDLRIDELKVWTESRFKWLVISFFTLVSVVTGLLALVK